MNSFPGAASFYTGPSRKHGEHDPGVFPCLVAGCSRTYSYETSARRHEREEHGYYRSKVCNVAMIKKAKMEAIQGIINAGQINAPMIASNILAAEQKSHGYDTSGASGAPSQSYQSYETVSKELSHPDQKETDIDNSSDGDDVVIVPHMD